MRKTREREDRGGGQPKKVKKRRRIALNESWYVYYGHALGMSRDETMATRYGEFMDMLACRAIDNGADVKPQKMKMEDVLKLR